jgi:hypothetical protein
MGNQLVSGQMFSERRFFARGTLLRISQMFTRPIRSLGTALLLLVVDDDLRRRFAHLDLHAHLPIFIFLLRLGFEPH